MQLVLAIESGPFADPSAAALSRMMIWLKTGQSITVGRDRLEAEFRIASDSQMSSLHFEVRCEKDGCFVRDLNSSNGTQLNGKEITEATLQHGDQLQAGKTVFGVRVFGERGEPVEPAKAATPSAPAPTKSSPSPDDTVRFELPPQTEPGDASVPPLQVSLQVVSGPWGEGGYDSLYRVMAWVRPGERLTVGRQRTHSDMAIRRDRAMSGAHFELHNDGRRCHLRDLQSSNGTFVDGQPVVSAMLRDHDEIQAGDTKFAISLTGGVPVGEDEQAIVKDSPEKSFRASAMGLLGPQGEFFRIVNSTPFPFAPLVGRVNHPKHSLTLIVKSTWNLTDDRQLKLADEQMHLSGAIEVGDPLEEPTSCHYDTDFAFEKCRADVMLVGKCFAPDGHEVAELPVMLAVGEWSKNLTIFGDRVWQEDTNDEMAVAKLFTEMDLGYENSFGGTGFEENPVGKGHYDDAAPDQRETRLLPNIEDPDALIGKASDRPAPAGFGPHSSNWPQRKAHLGTYDQAWQQSSWPWFPKDFNAAYFNAAPPDQQIDGFLTGDEPIVLRNLLRGKDRYRALLPGVRVRCFLNRLGKAFREVPMNLDTLWIQTEAEQLILVWRGVIDVESAECEDIRHVYIASENLADPPKSIGDCQAAFLETLAAEQGHWDPPAAEPPSGDESPQAAEAGKTPFDPHEHDLAVAQAEQDIKTEELKSQSREAQIASGAHSGFEPDDEGLDFRTMPPLTGAAEVMRQQMIRDQREAETLDATAAETRTTKKVADLNQQSNEAQASSGNEPPPWSADQQAEADESAQQQTDDQTQETPKWTRQRVQEHFATQGGFADEDLSGLDLSHLDFPEGNFRGAILAKATLDGCNFAGADLTLANLVNASLIGTTLDDATLDYADLTEARLDSAKLQRASATGAVFQEAKLRQANLEQLQAVGAYFAQADVSESSLRSANLQGADFSEAMLGSTNLEAAMLAQATLSKSYGPGANFNDADLSEVRAAECKFPAGKFERCIAADSAWSKATLDMANFEFADMMGADFTKASLSKANMHAVDLKKGRLTSATLADADMQEMNLFEANLQQADLTRADLSKANAYGAEFFDAVLDDANRSDTNLKMTKLAAAT